MDLQIIKVFFLNALWIVHEQDIGELSLSS